MSFTFIHPCQADPSFRKKVAYFFMGLGIHQPLKTYADGWIPELSRDKMIAFLYHSMI